MKWLLIAGGSLSLVAPALMSPLAAQTALQPGTSADQRLRSLYDGYARWDAEEAGYVRDPDGEIRALDYLPQVNPAAQTRRASHIRQLISQVDAIAPAQLSAEERVNAAVFRTALVNLLIDLDARSWEMPLNSDSNFWTYLDSSNAFQSEVEYNRYIQRMRALPRFFEEETQNMRAGLARGFSVPRSTLEGRDGSIAAFASATGAASAFYAPFRDMPAIIPPTRQAQLRAEALAAIAGSVVPAYAKLLDFYRNDYLTRTRTSVSARDMPSGDAFYRGQIKLYTTTDLSPEEIHKIGLAEVARIEAAMRQTMADSGFKGSFENYLKFLKTDPQFFAKTPDELMGVSSYVAKRVDGKLAENFALLPRRRFTIIPVPDALAPFYTAGRGGLENCQMNTYNLPTRPLYNIPALTLHECAPGHSFQAALSVEQKGLSAFRQNLYFSGYGEGWGLYTEWLGNEMGIYRTPYEKFGQLSYEMWRAARLVIDTGIHRYGWSRQQAIDYLAGHTALSDHEVETEVDRYISWPGQALSYKLGQMTILRLRQEAERKLGPKFDKRGFHDTFLAMGAVPLDVLEQQMHAWMAAEAAKPAK
ncbi:MAG: DUF885 family protein [Sphingomicrobium sp.]